MLAESFLLPLALLVLAAGAIVYGLQRHLLFPAPKPQVVLASPHHEILDVSIPVNGKILRGFLATPRGATNASLGLLYFNGRRENPSSIFRALAVLPEHQVLCFFYDRLGPAWRKPGESELVSDARAVLDWWARVSGMPLDRISVAGRSLGSGLAVQVAAARPIRRLVLVSPHDRLINAVRQRLPWFPRQGLKDPFDSCDHIAQVRCPCLLIVADEDTTIPVPVSRALFASWTGSLTEYVALRCGHRGILRRPDVHRALADFLAPTAPDQRAEVGM